MRRVESFPSYHGQTLAYRVIQPRLPVPRGRQLSDTKYVNRPRIALPSLGFTGMLTLKEEVARTDPSKGSPSMYAGRGPTFRSPVNTGSGSGQESVGRKGGRAEGRWSLHYLRMLCASMLRFWLLEHTTATRSGDDGMAPTELPTALATELPPRSRLPREEDGGNRKSATRKWGRRNAWGGRRCFPGPVLQSVRESDRPTLNQFESSKGLRSWTTFAGI